MHRKGMVGVLVLALTMVACDGDADDRHFAAYRMYQHDLFATPEECLAAQPAGGFYNCWQTVEFFPDGRVLLMVTDIINAGTYTVSVDDDHVRLEFGDGSEVGSRFTFDAEFGLGTLIDEGGNEWRLALLGVDECLIRYSAEECAP